MHLDDTRLRLNAAANQLSGFRNASRVVTTIGKFSVADVFDANQFAYDPRSDCLNWAAIDAGTFDYAADAWGYTAGAATEWYQGGWALRGGWFDLSTVPNGVHFHHAFHQFQAIIELEKRHELAALPGRMALALFDSRGRMGLLDDAVRLADSTAMAVDIAAVRRYRIRISVSVNLEQQMTAELAAFARLGRAAGNVESYEFTNIDRAVAVGVSLRATGWHRADDRLGVATIDNGVTAARQRYFNAGGLHILVGDGRLPHPGLVRIIETYYSLAVFKTAQLSFD